MTPYYQDGRCTIYQGDSRDILPQLPERSVHACVTSPPYFALRSYLPADHPDKDKEIGSEPTPEEFIGVMVDVFRGVWRVLRDDGILWVNLGDGYGGYHGNKNVPDDEAPSNKPGYIENMRTSLPSQNGQLLNIPHRVALALQADGWIHRDTVIWSKRSPMPSSQNGVRWERCKVKVKDTTPEDWREKGAVRRGVNDDGKSGGNTGIKGEQAKFEPCPGCDKCRDHGGYVLRRGQGRTTCSHEYLFMFTKTNDYHYDMENCREECDPKSTERQRKGFAPSKRDDHNNYGDGFQRGPGYESTTRIPRSVLTLSSESTSEAHFATYPSALVKFMLQPLSPKGCCPSCGAQWAPVVESERISTRPGTNSKVNRASQHEESVYNGHSGTIVGNRDPERHQTQFKVTDYRPTCQCPAHEPVGCTVLDVFSGLGTTGQTAAFLGHDYIGIELNKQYADLSKQWMSQVPRWHIRDNPTPPALKQPKSTKGQPLLF